MRNGQSVPAKRRLAILYQLPESWANVRSVWEAARDDADLDVIVVMLPFIHKDYQWRREVSEAHLNDMGVPFVAWDAFDLDKAGLDAVLSAGSTRGMAVGHEELTERAVASPQVSRLLQAGGGLAGEHVPWLLRAGVRQFHVGRSVRPGGSWKAYVDARHVRSWRMLLDDAVSRLG